MRRRDFIIKSISSLTLLGGAGVLQTLSAHTYNKVIQEGITTRFAVASDGHYGQPETSFDDYHREMMNWLNQEHARAPLDFTLFNGDLIHDDIALLPRVKEHYDHLQMPYHVSRGNHDRCDLSTWKSQWGSDLNYSFEIGDTAFVVLDTSNVKGEYLCPDEKLVNSLLQQHHHQRNLFVFMHITPLKWTGAGMKCDSLVKLFGRTANLKGIFHGHDHDQDNIKVAEGKHYLFDSHLGGSWGTEYRGYRIVEITSNNDIVTYQVNPAKQLHVNQSKL
jgi:3',5'-cyclic-AMP phosphodiesterase